MGGGAGKRNRRDGRGRGARVFRRDFGNRENNWKKPRHDRESRGNGEGEWRDGFSTDNPAFEDYYRRQGIVPEGEWETFISVLRSPLPVTFRINGSGKFACSIRDQMQHDFFDLVPLEVDNEEVDPPRPLPWYPDNLAWHLNYSRNQLRKNAVLGELHEFLKRENEAGNITRQEAVSMVPPLFLDVQPHHLVLDMCAAPGSKTFQLLEMLQKGDFLTLAPGMVIANDVDMQRCHLLIHQTKRAACPSLLVTNHEAQCFPRLRLRRRGGDNGVAGEETLKGVSAGDQTTGVEKQGDATTGRQQVGVSVDGGGKADELVGVGSSEAAQGGDTATSPLAVAGPQAPTVLQGASLQGSEPHSGIVQGPDSEAYEGSRSCEPKQGMVVDAVKVLEHCATEAVKKSTTEAAGQEKGEVAGHEKGEVAVQDNGKAAGQEKGEVAVACEKKRLGPSGRAHSGVGSGGGESEEEEGVELVFDRILCDVPCSGDGTLRKAPDIWRKWSPANGNCLHRLQICITMKAVELLKVGGLMVYSTCSLNPVEDEAVVAQVLRQSNGAIELLDVSSQLPDLKRHPGLTSWLVKDKGSVHTSYSTVEPYRRPHVTPSFFPSGVTSAAPVNPQGGLDPPRADAGPIAVPPGLLELTGPSPATAHPTCPAVKPLAAPMEAVQAPGLPFGVAGGVEAEASGAEDPLQAPHQVHPPASSNGATAASPGSVPFEEAVGLHSGGEQQQQQQSRAQRRRLAEGPREVCDLPLERCMRFLPHDQDTGGFFVAVLRKVAAYTGEPKRRAVRDQQQPRAIARADKEDWAPLRLPALQQPRPQDLLPQPTSHGAVAGPGMTEETGHAGADAETRLEWEEKGSAIGSPGARRVVGAGVTAGVTSGGGAGREQEAQEGKVPGKGGGGLEDKEVLGREAMEVGDEGERMGVAAAEGGDGMVANGAGDEAGGGGEVVDADGDGVGRKGVVMGAEERDVVDADGDDGVVALEEGGAMEEDGGVGDGGMDERGEDAGVGKKVGTAAAEGEGDIPVVEGGGKDVEGMEGGAKDVTGNGGGSKGTEGEKVGPGGGEGASKEGRGGGPREQGGGQRREQVAGRWRGVDPVLPVRDEGLLNSLQEFYGINEAFPFRTQLVTRSEDLERCKKIYFVSKTVLEVVKLNNRLNNPIRVASTGIKLFERQSSKDGIFPLRLIMDGLPLILPYLTRQIFYLSRQDFIQLLRRRCIPKTGFSDPSLVDALASSKPGCLVMALKREQTPGADRMVDSSPVAVVCWHLRSNINLLITKVDAAALLEKLGEGVQGGKGPAMEAPENGGSAAAPNVDDGGIPGAADTGREEGASVEEGGGMEPTEAEAFVT